MNIDDNSEEHGELIREEIEASRQDYERANRTHAPERVQQGFKSRWEGASQHYSRFLHRTLLTTREPFER